MEFNRQQLFVTLVSDLREAGETQSKLGTRILTNLWRIEKEALYKTETFKGTSFDSFRSMCEEVIAPSYENPDYLYDFVNIVDRVFSYLNIRIAGDDPLLNPQTEQVVSPEWCIAQKGWIGKLISISQSIENCKTDEEIEDLFYTAIGGTREDTKKKGEQIKNSHVPTKISMIQRFNGDESYTLITESISLDQVNLILHKLGSIVDLHLD